MRLSEIGGRIEDFLRRVAVGMLFSPETKKRVIAGLNSKVNVPLLSEAQEAELFELVWDAVAGAFAEDISPERG